MVVTSDLDRLGHVMVVGCQRTGTNLTGLILGTHPHSVLIEEDDGAYKYLRAESSTAGQRLAKVLAKARKKYKAPKRRFKGRHAIAPSVSHLVFQVHNSTYDYEELAAKLSNPHFVFPTRDVRDVVCSMARLRRVPMVENQLRFMKECPHVARAFGDEIALLEDPRTSPHAKRAMVWRVKTSFLHVLLEEPFNASWVRYEELVRSPAAVSKSILAAVGLPQLEQDLSRDSLDETYQGVGMGDTNRTWQIRQDSVGRWRDGLSAAEEAEIWEVAGELMTRLGYER